MVVKVFFTRFEIKKNGKRYMEISFETRFVLYLNFFEIIRNLKIFVE